VEFGRGKETKVKKRLNKMGKIEEFEKIEKRAQFEYLVRSQNQDTLAKNGGRPLFGYRGQLLN
jgi:hypothetical protein